MANWLLKAAVHHVLRSIPWGQRLNEVLQVYVTQSLELTTGRFENKLSDCRRHWRHYANYSAGDTAPRRVVELGSGWYPVTPLGLFLCGVDEIYTCDIAPLLRPERVRLAMRRIIEYHQHDKLVDFLPDVDPQRLDRLEQVLHDASCRTVDDLLSPLGIRVLVSDAQNLPLDTASIDLLTSYGVLMHIEPPILLRVLAEFRRIAKPTAVMSHWIDLCDLYHWADGSISPFNFLRYSDELWRLLNDPLVPANRLRVCDYRRLLADAGFELVEESSRTGEQQDLDRIRLAPRFAQYKREDLLVLDTWMASRLLVVSGEELVDRRSEVMA